MRCTSPIQIKNKSKLSSRAGLVVPCSQCLPCRINRRDRWVTRGILEHRSRFTGQFWTLTFSEEGLDTLSTHGARKLVHQFLDSLRTSERRHGNPLPIRFFGCLEHGELFGRPHVHLLLWNLIHNFRNSTPYKPLLPRPTFNIGLWPHGHVDVQPLTIPSIRYVAKYVTKFEEDQTIAPVCFRTIKPPLGLDGLEQLVRDISRGPTKGWLQSPSIQIDGNNWELDQTMQKHYRRLCRNYGIKTEGVFYPDKAHRQLDQLKDRYAESVRKQEKRWQDFQTKEKLYADTAFKRKLRLASAASACFKRATLSTSQPATTPASVMQP
ncbi:replication initiator protein [Microviridae sp.]|nr:replication initiator protein [Microviridae sp.]